MDMNTPKKQPLTTTQRAIIKEWKHTRVVHPSYNEIAKKVGCSKQTVYKTVQRYLNT